MTKTLAVVATCLALTACSRKPKEPEVPPLMPGALYVLGGGCVRGVEGGEVRHIAMRTADSASRAANFYGEQLNPLGYQRLGGTDFVMGDNMVVRTPEADPVDLARPGGLVLVSETPGGNETLIDVWRYTPPARRRP